MYAVGRAYNLRPGTKADRTPNPETMTFELHSRGEVMIVSGKHGDLGTVADGAWLGVNCWVEPMPPTNAKMYYYHAAGAHVVDETTLKGLQVE